MTEDPDRIDTRRAPHMERYVKVIPQVEGYRVRLEIGNQGFLVGDDWETAEEAEWYRDMLCIALDMLVDRTSTDQS